MSFIVNVLRNRLLVVLLLTGMCFGQGGGNFVRQVVSGTVANGGSGQVIPNANVIVCTPMATGTPCSPLANIYADQALTQPLGNPFAADINGLYSFFIATGVYEIQESAPIGAGFAYNESFLIFANSTGTVSSVSLTIAPTVFTVSGSPCSIVCNLDAEFIAQPPLSVLGNFSNSSGAPSFGSLSAAMIPATLNSTTINGTLNVVGASTLAALSAAAVSSTSNTTGTSIVTGNESVGGTLGVTGLSTLISLTVPGSASLSGGGSLSGTFAGSPTFNGNPAFTGFATFNTVNLAPLGAIKINGFLGSSGTCLQVLGFKNVYAPGCSIGGTPAINLLAGAGTGATVATGANTDVMGLVNVTTGSSPTVSSPIFAVVFSTPYATSSFCVVSAASPTSAAVINNVWVSTNGTPEFVLYNTGSALSGATTYSWSYNCRGY